MPSADPNSIDPTDAVIDSGTGYVHEDNLPDDVPPPSNTGGGLTPGSTPSTTGTGTDWDDVEYQWIKFPSGNSVVLAFGVDGDAAPRVVWMADQANGIYFGDGTEDPKDTSPTAAIYLASLSGQPRLMIDGFGNTLELSPAASEASSKLSLLAGSNSGGAAVLSGDPSLIMSYPDSFPENSALIRLQQLSIVRFKVMPNGHVLISDGTHTAELTPTGLKVDNSPVLARAQLAYFRGYLPVGTTHTGGTDKVQYVPDVEVNPTESGGWDNDTKIYTVPQDGLYRPHVVDCGDAGATNLYIKIFVNGVVKIASPSIATVAFGGTHAFGDIYLQANDEVYVNIPVEYTVPTDGDVNNVFTIAQVA